MKHCQNCGQQIEDSAKFCQGCGCTQGEATADSTSQSQTSGRKRLHCPDCKSTLFTPIVETTNNGGQAIHMRATRRVGVTSYTASSTHRNYWMCQSCGTKFRNLQNLKEELTSESKQKTGNMYLFFVSGGGDLLLYRMAMVSEGAKLILFPFIILLTVTAIVCFYLWMKKKSNVKRMTEEKEYLEANCFDQ